MAAIGTMTLTTARDIAAQAVIRDGSYDPTNASQLKRLDYAIQAAGQEFQNRVRCDRAVDSTLSTTIQQQTLNISTITGLKPENFLFAEMVDDSGTFPLRYKIVPIAYDDMAQLTLNPALFMQSYIWAALSTSPQYGYPSVLSFNDDRTTVWFYPVPNVAKTIRFYYWRPFVAFAAGTATPNSVILNIPDDLVYEFLYKGVAYYYDIAEAPTNDMYGSMKKARKADWDEFIERSAGSVSSMAFIMPIPSDGF